MSEQQLDLYAFPSDPNVINTFVHGRTDEQFPSVFSADYAYGYVFALSLWMGIGSYINLRQPQGDAIRMRRFQQMTPMKRAYIRGLPAFWLGLSVYCARQSAN